MPEHGKLMLSYANIYISTLFVFHLVLDYLNITIDTLFAIIKCVDLRIPIIQDVCLQSSIYLITHI